MGSMVVSVKKNLAVVGSTKVDEIHQEKIQAPSTKLECSGMLGKVIIGSEASQGFA
jgi:hypothetical protein